MCRVPYFYPLLGTLGILIPDNSIGECGSGWEHGGCSGGVGGGVGTTMAADDPEPDMADTRLLECGLLRRE
jgi:hypothetical protein